MSDKSARIFWVWFTMIIIETKNTDELRHKPSTLITFDDLRHRTQFEKNMIIANIFSNSQVRENNEAQLKKACKMFISRTQ